MKMHKSGDSDNDVAMNIGDVGEDFGGMDSRGMDSLGIDSRGMDSRGMDTSCLECF